MSVFLRVDDFPWVKPEERDKHNLENFKKFDAVLGANSVPQYTLGVIPSRVTKEDLEWLKANPHIRVAMHGIDHDNRYPNEFRPYETSSDIYRKIVDAKKIFSGYANVECYIPPFNAVDLTTARAIFRAGFTELMCGPGTDLKEFAMIKNARFFGPDRLTYSDHPVFYGRSDEMMDRDDSVRHIKESKGDVVTLHWTWEHNIGLRNLERFMGQLRGVWGTR